MATSRPGLQGGLALLRPEICFRNKRCRSSRPFIEVEYSIGISGQILQERISPS
jgi:hypothetical protein